MTSPAPKRIVGLGAGGHAKMVIEALRASRAGEIVALLDADPALRGQTLCGVTIIGDDGRLASLLAEGVDGFIVTVGMIGHSEPRQRLWALGLSCGLLPASAVHPTAVVSPSATIAVGAALLPGSIVNAGAWIGQNAIINSGAVVEHDCRVGDHAHIATGARLSGDVHVGAGAHIGVGASVRQGVRIGDGAVVGAGAAVIGDVAPGMTVVGVPARPMKSSRGG